MNAPEEGAALTDASTWQPQPAGLLVLATHMAQMGNHSGYHLLAKALKTHWPGRTEVIYRRLRTAFPRVLHKLTIPFLRRQHASPSYNYLGMLLEMQAMRRMARGDIALTHMLFTENDLHLLARRPHQGCLIGSIHKPADWWRNEYPAPQNFQAFDGIVAMARDQIPFLRENNPRALIEFHRLGIDLDFFRPAEPARSLAGPPRFISVGVHVRDFETLSAVIELALAHIPEVCFDLVLPERIQRDAAMQKWVGHPQIAWYADISSERLLELYHGAIAQILPLKGTAANNAAVEAAACGVPVIATDLPGIRDYASEDFADFIAPRGAEDFFIAMQRLLDNSHLRRQRATAARRFAEDHFGWAKLAAEMVDFYRRVMAHTR